MLRLALIGLLIVTAPRGARSQDVAETPRPAGAEWDAPPFVFDTIAPGVYQARGTAAMVVGSNATIVEGPDDLLVVDSHMTPAAAWALAREVRAVTDKPIRTVVNTHFHFDHAGGNQVYPDHVEIIGHEFTRKMIESGYAFDGRSYHSFLDPLPDGIARLRAAIDTMSDTGARATVQSQLAIQERFAAADAAIVATPPTVTLSERMTLYRGDREIQLIFLGRGHTGGDVVVYLPAEKILITGDLLLPGVPFMGDAYVQDWPRTLRALKSLDAEVFVPGHGEATTDMATVDHLIDLLADLWEQAEELHARGVSPDEAMDRIDLSGHSAHYQNPQSAVNRLTVQRMYDVMNGDEEGHEHTGSGN